MTSWPRPDGAGDGHGGFWADVEAILRTAVSDLVAALDADPRVSVAVRASTDCPFAIEAQLVPSVGSVVVAWSVAYRRQVIDPLSEALVLTCDIAVGDMGVVVEEGPAATHLLDDDYRPWALAQARQAAAFIRAHVPLVGHLLGVGEEWRRLEEGPDPLRQPPDPAIRPQVGALVKVRAVSSEPAETILRRLVDGMIGVLCTTPAEAAEQDYHRLPAWLVEAGDSAPQWLSSLVAERSWSWWDAEVQGKDALDVWLVQRGLPEVPTGLYQLLVAAGADACGEPVRVE